MGKDTKIEWCDSTINPTSGCGGCELWTDKVRTCYAGIMHENRLAKTLPDLYDRDFKVVRIIRGRMNQSAHWKDMKGVNRSEKPWLNDMPRHIFVGDMSDVLSEGISDRYFIEEIIQNIKSDHGRQHMYIILTKRPKRLAKISQYIGGLPDNVIAMTTVTDQNTLRKRLPALMNVDCRFRGLSVEPMLEQISISMSEGSYFNCLHNNVDWVICGGESGPNARPMNPEWAIDLKRQCRLLAIPFFMKQLGGTSDKGGDFNNFPSELQVREMPE